MGVLCLGWWAAVGVRKEGEIRKSAWKRFFMLKIAMISEYC